MQVYLTSISGAHNYDKHRLCSATIDCRVCFVSDHSNTL